MKYNDEFLGAVGAWQRGWREDQDRKAEVTERLLKAISSLPSHTPPSVGKICYRKRFLRKCDLPGLFLGPGINDGPAAWTTDVRFAENFKGFVRDGHIGAIFGHLPRPDEVVLDIGALWRDPEFVTASKSFRDRVSGPDADALFHFEDRQNEVVVKAKLVAEEVVGFSGKSSPFEELCEQAGVAEADQDRAFKALVDAGEYPELPRWLNPRAAQRVVARTRAQFASRASAKKNIG